MNPKQIEQAYQNIWDKFQGSSLQELLDRGFVFQFDEEIKEQPCEIDVLFVGINPSYLEEKVDKRYTTKQAKRHPYFQSFDKVILNAENIDEPPIKIKWTHLDLLVFRETKQSFIKDVLFKTDEGVNFIMDQLKVSKKLIEHIKPKITLVANTMAKELLGKNRRLNNEGEEVSIWMGYRFDFDNAIGTDRIISDGPLKNTAVFFTSMLSGQRALDNGSKERLAWHINRVLSNKL